MQVNVESLTPSTFGHITQLGKSQSNQLKQAVNELMELKPYSEGEWLKLEPKEESSRKMTNLGKERDIQLSFGFQGDENKEIEEGGEEEEKDSEDHIYMRDNILRGPIWNYGLRKLSADKDYYDNVIFGIPWASLKTPENMILRGEEWTGKPITSSLIIFIMRKLKKMNPKKTALVELETGRTLSYGELAQKVESLACGLHWLGVQPKQIMAIVSYQSLEAHVMLLACLLIGAVVALVDSSLNPVELSIVLRNTSPNLLFTEVGKTLYKVEAAISYLELSIHNPKPELIINSSTPGSSNYFLFHQLLKEVDPLKPIPGPRRADPLRPILILYTGSPENLRACLISERHFTLSMAFVDSVVPKTDEPTITVMIIPPMYASISIKTVLNHYIDGHRILLCRGQIPEPCLITALRKFEVFGFLTTREPLMNLMDWPARPRCPHLKVICVVGVPLRLKNLLRINNDIFKNQVLILQIYGTVETGTIAANTFFVNKYGSVGKLFNNVEIKVLEEGSGVPLGFSQEGELCVRSPTMMLGYYNNLTANQKAMDAEGFFHTGDLGYYDEEDFVYVTDRVREMIKWRTYLISPSSVEEVLLEQPEVKEVLVFGLFDKEDGEVVTAAVIFEFGHEYTDTFALEKRVNAVLPFHRKIRGGVHVFQQFPRSTVGKPVREPVLKEVMERKRMSGRGKSF